jgi:replication factor C subunit 2/4
MKPWIEKYRPKSIDEIVLDSYVRSCIDNFVKDNNLPNIIITGPPGVGKTTTIKCLASKLLGSYAKEAVLELNASDDRGIKIVQESIIAFAKKVFINNSTKCKHKLIILDEADNMTIKALRLVKSIMQEYHNTTRFAFTCNNSSKIIESIQSRCIVFKYKRLNDKQIIKRLEFICKSENVDYDLEGLKAISVISQGDLRSAINNLQLIYFGFKSITVDTVFSLADTPHPLIIKDILLACIDKDLQKALKLLDTLIKQGYSGNDLILTMKNTLKSELFNGEIDEGKKNEILETLCGSSFKINKGIDTYLQITGTLSLLCV